MSASVDVAGIKALDREQLADALDVLGEPRYRTEQLVRWLYLRGATSYDEMTDLPAGLRDELAGRFPVYPPEIVERRHSKDGTRKYLIALSGPTLVETVGLPTSGRLTVCFSTQAGCAMGCAFCATGQGGFVRDLGPGEMVDQVRLVAEDFGTRVTNAVAMGQGEPFANYDATLGALRLLNSPNGLGIGARHITVSTCGLVPGIRRFAEEPEQFTLAVSLHSAVQETRDRLMPGVAGMPLETLREALIAYANRSGRRPSLEYALIDRVNDSSAELNALIEFCRGLLVHVNLIPVNTVDSSGFARSDDEVAARWIRELGEHGVEASVRSERGADIDAACGQLKQRTQRTT
ncbi:MAG: 23S rRNA (adenine(2503)-C(2))-methyltransferase RlmN [Coriobacteriales bacterium]|nr:23S rRNA (adenine(2503)-C(2))-methyltransferase RlmN [Coriobacteriales bacterium]